MENMEEKYIFFTKQLILPVIYLSLHYVVRRNNSVIGGHNSLCEE